MKKSIIMIACCTLTACAVTAGSFAVFAKNNNNAAEVPISSDNGTDIVQMFEPSEHIKGRYNDIMTNEVVPIDNECLKKLVFEQEGVDLDAYYRGEVKSSKNFSEDKMGDFDLRIVGIGIQYQSDVIDDLLIKIANDGYADPSLVPEKDDDTPICETDINRFCNILTMAVNAYNDPGYELTDVERVRLLDFFENAYSQMKFYKYNHPDEDFDRIDLTMNYIEKTYTPECGHKPME